jgi:hypothetical protein
MTCSHPTKTGTTYTSVYADVLARVGYRYGNAICIGRHINRNSIFITDAITPWEAQNQVRLGPWNDC